MSLSSHFEPDGSLVVRDRPRWIPTISALFVFVGLASLLRGALDQTLELRAALGALLAVLLGGGLLLFTARTLELRFDPRSRRAKWRRVNFLGVQSRGEIPFDEIERVGLRRDDETDNTRVVLVLPSGEFPLSTGFSPGRERHEAVVAAIRGVLE
jgi:hypothetical protein